MRTRVSFSPLLPLTLTLCLCAGTPATTDAIAVIEVETPGIRGIPVVAPANADDFALVLKNTGDTPETGHFTAILTPPSGEPILKLQKPLALTPGENVRLATSLAGKELGVWTLAWEFSPAPGAGSAIRHTPDTPDTPGTARTARSQRFALMEPAGPDATRPAFRFGIVAHIESGQNTRADRQREIAAAALIGCKTIRSNPTWWAIQPEPDRWQWDIMDELVNAYAADGMEMQALLGYSVRWAVPPAIKGYGKDVLFAAPDPAAWRAYVAASVHRYKGRVRLWEPWNEPDLGFWRGTTEEYIRLARITIEEVRRHDPDAKILTSGFATLTPHAGRKLNPDLQERVLRELAPLFDYHAVHEHGAFPAFAHLVDGAYATLRAGLPAPIPPPLFFNETALTAAGGGPDAEKTQAETLVKKATFARSRGAAGYLWYDLRNDGDDPANPEHNYGLLTGDLQPKPAYAAFNTHARAAIPRPFLRQLDAGKNLYLFLHGSHPATTPDNTPATTPTPPSLPPPLPPSLLLVFWDDDPTARNTPLLLRLPGATRATLIDINGNPSPLEITGETVAINATGTPRYLVAEHATDMFFESRLASPPAPHFGSPGEEIPVTCEFRNPFEHPLRVNVRWTPPLAMKTLRPAAPALQIAPRGKALSTLILRLPEGPAYRFGQSGRLRLDYDYEGAPFSGSLQIPVHYGAIRIPATATAASAATTVSFPFADREPDLVLDGRDAQLHSFVEADPDLVAHRWRGAGDLSARIWFGADAATLVLRIEVTDNRHHQTQDDPADMWREDSVQCTLEIPGQRGFWELGFADHDTRGPISTIWIHPSRDTHDVPPELAIRLDVKKHGPAGQGRIYTARIPRAELKLTEKILRGGFRFNIAINDHDGVVRAHALQLVPGIVHIKSTENIPYVIFE
ncbi:MAG: hypothetical protein LBK99_18470 [Opitutaceae bacterium]|jgi:hypothetical protein|nr:hypothetical protein [Opitutaceae bacterium]